jgi:hypothetical protein
VLEVPAYAAVRPPEIDSPGSAKDRTRRLGFGKTFVDGAVTAHLTRRQVAQPDAMTVGHMFRDRPSKTDLEVVGVRAEDEQVDRIRHATRRLINAVTTPRYNTMPTMTRCSRWIPRGFSSCSSSHLTHGRRRVQHGLGS